MWDESGVREWRDVRPDARRKGIKAHVGHVFCICVEKNLERLENGANRKLKGVRSSVATMSSTTKATAQSSKSSAPPQQQWRQHIVDA